MKISFKSLLALAAFGASALISQAQQAPKILVIDIGKALQAHYKRADAEESLKADQQKGQTEFAAKQKDLVDLSNKIKDLDEQKKNPALTKEAQAKIDADGEKLIQEYQTREQDLQMYAQKANRDINEKYQSITATLVEDITKRAQEIGKKKGADFVLPKNYIVYNTPALDITDEVIADINKDKPAGTTAVKPAAPAPATAPVSKPAAPASGDATPTVVFPGAKK